MEFNIDRWRSNNDLHRVFAPERFDVLILSNVAPPRKSTFRHRSVSSILAPCATTSTFTATRGFPPTV
jgi:hypothetical protein